MWFNGDLSKNFKYGPGVNFCQSRDFIIIVYMWKTNNNTNKKAKHRCAFIYLFLTTCFGEMQYI